MPIENLDTGTIFTQILILFILAAIGFVSGKTGYLPEKSGHFVSKLVMRITMPALIFSKMVSADFSADTYFDGFKLAGIAAGAEVNVQSDWNATSGDAYILNKPVFATINGHHIDKGGDITIAGLDDPTANDSLQDIIKFLEGTIE